MTDSYSARTTFSAAGRDWTAWRLDAVAPQDRLQRLPWSLRVLLENLVRREDGEVVTRDDIDAIVNWNPAETPSREIQFMPARVLMQDFTGVPALVDLAAMRDAMREMGGDPALINPLQQADLVIDHSVQVDAFGTRFALNTNIEREYERNGERYAFLRWGQQSFENFTVVPPGTGIVHQINIEHLATVAYALDQGDADPALVYPDTLVGTDSHTTMANGLGVLGWGVGGIEAEAAMLGQPVSMLIPQVVGFELSGELTAGVTATDLVLTVTQMLREHGVVGRFVEFFGDGLQHLSLADRATIGNMSPEFGSTCAIFPVDAETLRYLELTGRSREQIELVEAYYRLQGMFHEPGTPAAEYTSTLRLDLGDVVPSIAGPKRPQDRIRLSDATATVASVLEAEGRTLSTTESADDLRDGAVVIAAITSCTNTSNPSVMVAAGLLAQKALALGLTSRPWVKTSLAPGSKVVTRYLEEAGLDSALDGVGFATVGYGCTTCIGNSGPLPEEISAQINRTGIHAASVLSGNRNFEGRINGDVRMNFLASPPLVVAYAIAGSMNWNPDTDPIGTSSDGSPVMLADIWPSAREVAEVVGRCVQSDMFRRTYDEVYDGDERWRALPVPEGDSYDWSDDSTYVRRPPYFDGMPRTPEAITDIVGARCLVKVGDSITTDHISPAGAFRTDTPAGTYLQEHGVEPRAFNSYGSRRGNHEIMMRGTFANVRLRNELAPGTEGGFTTWWGDNDSEVTSIFDASERYRNADVPTVVLAGEEYGSGSSRDWAAKGPRLLGVRAAIAKSYERIHRSNLVGMGILPLQFLPGEGAAELGLDGSERFDIVGVADLLADGLPAADARLVNVTATRADGSTVSFTAVVRIDTPNELHYYEHGGILQYVLRGLLAREGAAVGV